MKSLLIATDLSEVLIRGMYGIEIMIAERLQPQYIKRYGTIDGRYRAYSIGQWVRGKVDACEAEFHELMLGHMTEDEFWSIALEGNDHIIELAKEAFGLNMQVSIPGTLDVYKRIKRYPSNLLRSNHTKVDGRPEFVIVSDHIRERVPEIRENHPEVFSLASQAFMSCDIGLLKTSPVYFGEFLRRVDRDASEVLFIDDNPANITSARRSNIAGIHFCNSVQLETVLTEAYGFEFR